MHASEKFEHIPEIIAESNDETNHEIAGST